MCLTNFLPAKTAYKKTICTFPVVICQRHKPHHLQNYLPKISACAKYKAADRFPSSPKMKRRNFQWMFRSFIFGELNEGSRGAKLPCKFRMCPDRVHPVQNGMPFCETCLSSPPRLQRFLRGVDVGKAASERALLFPHPLPKKSSETSKGMIVVL